MTLQVNNLTIKYGSRLAISGLTKTFKQGDCYALTGPNGSGKSSLLKAMAGLITPSSGSIHFNESSINNVQPDKIGLLLQRSLLLSGSVSHNVEFGLNCLGLKHSEITERVEYALNLVGATGLKHRNRRALSGGEIQKVALARILALEPEVLLLDEPFTHLDTRSANQLLEILKRLNEKGLTIIVATHSDSPGYLLGAEIIALMHGELVLPDIQNIFYGTALNDKGKHLLKLRSGHLLEHTNGDIQGSAAFRIDPSALILSRTPLSSSARNSVPARIDALIAESDRIRVELFCEDTRLIAYLTKDSVKELQLNIGDAITLVFKASALKLCRINR